MSNIIKKSKKPIIIGIATVLLGVNIACITHADDRPYGIYLPKYMGVTNMNSKDGKITQKQVGANLNYDITGDGSYAMDYYMSNSNGDQRGDYKSIQEGTYQQFNETGVYGKDYYLTAMNYSSISSQALATGDWSADVDFVPTER